MICHIDANNGVPIYEQIERHVTYAVASGTLLVGERVPSVRDMATRTAVNVNTVARAYRQLQDQGVLTSIRGTGLAVAATAPEICQQIRLTVIQERLTSALREALTSGLSQEQVQQLVTETCARLSEELPQPP